MLCNVIINPTFAIISIIIISKKVIKYICRYRSKNIDNSYKSYVQVS